MANKICLITGTSSGIGLETVIGLAKIGFSFILLNRNKRANENSIAQITERCADVRIES